MTSSKPSVSIVGAGAIGGWLAGVLDAGGMDVRLLARGATLAAIRTDGLRLRTGGQTQVLRLAAADRPQDLGPADYLVLAVKTQALPDLGAQLAPLVGPHTAVITAMNGLQWWFGDGLPSLCQAPLQAVDPQGALARLYPPSRVIGCVVHATSAAVAPGIVEVIGTDRLIFGEACGEGSPRLDRLVEACRTGGVATQASADIRLDIWRKLWGNMCMNPLSALTGATTGRLLDDPLTRELVRAMMSEMSIIGDQLGLPLGMTPEQRMDVTRRLGDFRTSMQRDAEAGRPMEIEALLGVLVEIAERLAASAPTLRSVYGLVRQLDRSLGARLTDRTS